MSLPEEGNMSHFAEYLALGMIGGILIGGGSGREDPSASLAGDDGPKLKETLVLREQQGGIAGVTGTIRTVQPDGQWRLEGFRTAAGKEQARTIKTGRLSPAELEALAKSLADHDFLNLPEKVGNEEPVNSHRIIVQYGNKRTTLSGISPRLDADEATKALIMRTASDRGLAEDKIWTRCAELADSIESRVAPPKK